MHCSLKVSNVKRAAMGTNGNIWKAVKIAKNLNMESLPKNLTLGGMPIAVGDIAGSFATHFNEKVKSNVEKTKVCPNVYNGKCKLMVQSRDFMKPKDVSECMNILVNKRCEGYDRIPLSCNVNVVFCVFEKLTVIFICVTEFIKSFRNCNNYTERA